MANQEMPQIASQPEEIDLHDDARRRTLDAQGYSLQDIDRMVGAPDPDRVPYPKPRPKPHRVSHRGGRSYPEEYENPQTALPPEQLSAEQIETNRRGALLARRALAASNFDRDVQDAKELGIPLMALQRARADRAARGK